MTYLLQKKLSELLCTIFLFNLLSNSIKILSYLMKAIKNINDLDNASQIEFLNMVNIRHENIVRYLNYLIHGINSHRINYILTEYCEVKYIINKLIRLYTFSTVHTQKLKILILFFLLRTGISKRELNLK